MPIRAQVTCKNETGDSTGARCCSENGSVVENIAVSLSSARNPTWQWRLGPEARLG